MPCRGPARYARSCLATPRDGRPVYAFTPLLCKRPVENGRADRCASFRAKLCVAGGGAGYYIFTTIGAWTAGERLRPSSRKLDAKPHALRGFAIHVPGG